MSSHPTTRERPHEATVKGLMARGADKHTAERLSMDGHTISSLQLCQEQRLLELELSVTLIEALRGTRPPIPGDTLNELLYAARWACCVCRERARGVTVHHIDPWETSKSHALDNLVVLCLDHHGEAHTQRSMQLNLSPDRLRLLRDKWNRDVRQLDAATITDPRTLILGEASWDYFNHRRIIEVARGLQIDLGTIPEFEISRDLGLLDNEGNSLFMNSRGECRFVYETGGIRSEMASTYRFFAALVRRVYFEGDWVNLTDNWSPSSLSKLAIPGRLAWLRGPFDFKRRRDFTEHVGEGQIANGSRVANGICFSIDLDAWEATSSSAWGGYLSRRNVLSCFCLIRGVERLPKPQRRNVTFRLDARCLALGSGFFGEPLSCPYPDLTTMDQSYQFSTLAQDMDDEGNDSRSQD